MAANMPHGASAGQMMMHNQNQLQLIFQVIQRNSNPNQAGWQSGVSVQERGQKVFQM